MDETQVDSRKVNTPDAKGIAEHTELSPEERWKIEDYDLKGCKYPGKFVVFNHYSYNKKLNLSSREGTNEDAKRIKKTFEKMGFHEADKCQEDLTCEEVMDKVNEVTLESFKDYGSIVIVILTHGELGRLYAKDKEYEVTMLWNILTQAKNAKNLAGKPKLFLIQACQGEDADDGISTMCDAVVVEEQKIFRIPLFADFLVAFSSSPGFLSFRQASGSWFIQCLCDAIDQFKDLMDFESVLTMVKYDIAHNKESYSPRVAAYHSKKQIPVVSSTLTKKLYLTTTAANKEKNVRQHAFIQPNLTRIKGRQYESEESDVDSRSVKVDQTRKRSTTKIVHNSNVMHESHSDLIKNVDPRTMGIISSNDDYLSGSTAITMIITFLVTCFIFWMLRSDYHIHCNASQ